MTTSLSTSVASEGTWNELTFNREMLKYHGEFEEEARRSLTEAQCQAMFLKHQLALLVDPGTRPRGVLIGDTAILRRFKESELKLWLIDKEAYDKQVDGMKAYKKRLLNGCPVEALDGLTHGVTGTNHLDPTAINVALYAKYGTISSDTLRDAKKLLPTVLHGASTKDLQGAVNSLNKYFHLKEAALQPSSNDDKIVALMNLLPSVYDIHIVLYDKDHSALVDRTFETFSTAMLLASKQIRTDPSANSVSTTATEFKSWNEFMANAAAAATAAGYSKPKYANVIPLARNSPNAHLASLAPHQMHYCWSHGPNASHSSTDCKKKHINHVNTATFANNHGGKTTVWERNQNLGP